MAADRTVSVALKAKVDGYVPAVKKAEKATTDLAKAQEKQKAKSIEMGRTMAAVGVTVAVAFGKQAIDAASNLNETMSKSSVVFGKSAASVQKWSTTSATAMGMSQQQALEAAATYGNLFVALGITGDKAAQMSTKMVGLAADLASFNNVSPEEALQALQSGLVGEVEPLRKFGVNLNDATLRQEALSMGLVKNTKSVLPPAIKAQAAYALILQQTKTAQGDFGRTSDGLANQQRILTAEWTNMQAALGSALLPAVTAVIKVMNIGLGVFTAMPGPLRNIALAVGVLGAAFIILAPRINNTKNALKGLGVTGAGMKGALGKAGALGAVTAILAVLGQIQSSMSQGMAPGLDTLAKKLNNVGTLGSEQFSTIGGTAYSLNEALGAIASNGNIDQITTGFAGLFGVKTGFAQMKDQVASLDGALAQMVGAGNIKGAAEAFKYMSDQLVAGGMSAADAAKVFPQYQNSLDAAAKTTDVAAAASTKHATTLDVQAKKMKAASDQASRLSDALTILRGGTLAADQANAGLEQAIDAATKSIKDNGHTLDVHSEKGRNNRAALQAIADGAFQLVDSYAAAGKSTREITRRTQDARNAFVEAARRMGMSKDAAGRLADSYGLIPKKISTIVSVNTGEAQRKINALNAQMAALAQRQETAREGARAAANGSRPAPATRRATGGAISGPGNGTSDSVPIWASNGEYVIRASSVAKYGTGMLDHINAGRYAKGGKVSPAAKAAKAAAAAYAARRSAARDAYMSAVSDRAQDAATTRARLSGSAQLVGTFDFSRAAAALGVLTQAKLKQADAETALFEARRKSNAAGTPEEIAAATLDQAKAEQDLADAKKETAAAQKDVAASKPTSANILAGFKGRAQKLAAFRSNMTKLAKSGLSRTILQQILEAGIDDGGDMAAALVAGGGIRAFNAVQSGIDKNAAALGALGTSIDGADDRVARAAVGYGLTGGRVGAKGNAANMSLQITGGTPVVLKINNRALAEELLVLSRRQGGYTLTAKR